VDWQPLAGRSAVLIPTADDSGRQVMARLAVVLAEAGLVLPIKGVNVEIIPLNSDDESPEFEAPDGWCLADAVRLGWTPESALRWAKRNRMTYDPPTPIPAPGAEEAAADTSSPARPASAPAEQPPVAGSDGAAPQEVPITHRQMVPSETSAEPAAAPPESPETSAAAEAIASIAPGSSAAPEPPTLGVVDGNTVRKPRKRIEAEAEVDLPPGYSEFGLADALVAKIGEDWRHVPARNLWYRWDGSIWREDERDSLHYRAQGIITAYQRGGDLTASQRNRVCSDKTIRSVKYLAGRYPGVAVAADAWNRDPMLLGTPAGVVDLRAGKLIESAREQLISKATSVAPVEAPTPLFDRVIDHAAHGDESMRGYLLRWLGYLLTGDCSEEKFLFLIGEGGSGKSTLVNLAADVLGDYAVACKPGMFESTKHEAHPEEIARLVGARLAHASETEEGARFNESKIKWLTGRDKVSARFMREGSFDFQPTHKIIIHGNHRPGLRSVGAEMRRRICLVDWPPLPEEERDARLKDALRAEYPAILHRMIRACLEWQDVGLGSPEAVSDAVSGYLRSEDTIGSWCEDCTEAGPDRSSLSGDAYKRYRAWCESEGEHFTLSHKRFSQKLKDRGYTLVKRGGQRMFEGFSLRIAAPREPSYADL